MEASEVGIPREGAITATVGLMPEDATRPDGPAKVRLTIWSGGDYRSPVIERGAIFPGRDEALVVGAQCVRALEQLGIPLLANWEAGPDGPPRALLPVKRPECEYDRIGGGDG